MCIRDSISSVGHLLICDFFRRDVPGKSPMGGGHSWQGFKDTISTLPLQQVTELDISEETAPTIDLLDQFCQDVLMPISEMSGSYLQYKYPYLTKLLNWKLKKRIEKIRSTYLSGELNGDSFKKFKTYRLLLYKRKIDGVEPDGIEPTTSWMPFRRSPNWATAPIITFPQWAFEKCSGIYISTLEKQWYLDIKKNHPHHRMMLVIF